MARTISKKTTKRGATSKRIADAIRDAMAKCQEAFDMAQGLSEPEDKEEALDNKEASDKKEATEISDEKEAVPAT
jgi:hypothetical protein